MSHLDETLSIIESVAKLKSIKYFTPARAIEEANSLLPKVSEMIQSYIDVLGPWVRQNDSLQHASDSLWDLARIAAMKGDRQNTWDSAWDFAWKEAGYSARDNYGWFGGGYMTGESARDAARDAAKYAARFIAFESAKERLGNTNPFRYILELYAIGLKPTCFRKINEEEKFVVDFPLKVGNKFLIGCYAHGDNEILFTHEWKEYCANLQPIKYKENLTRSLS